MALGTGIIWTTHLAEALELPKPMDILSNHRVSHNNYNLTCTDNEEVFRDNTFKILILPLGYTASCALQDNQYHKALKDRFEKVGKQYLNLQVCILDSIFCTANKGQMHDVAVDNDADLIIWGNYSEYCEWDTSFINVFYHFTSNAYSGFFNDEIESKLYKYYASNEIKDGKISGTIEDIMLYTLGMREYNNRNYANAIEIFSQISTRSPFKISYVLLLIGICNYSLGEYEKASKVLELSVKYEKPTNHPEHVYFIKGRSNMEIFNYESALNDFYQAIKYDSLNRIVYYHSIYEVLKKANRYPEAVEIITKCINMDSTLRYYYIKRGEIYSLMEKYCLAYSDYNKFPIDSIQYWVHYMQIACLEETGDNKTAESELRKYIYNYPDSTTPKLLLSYFYKENNDTMKYANFFLEMLRSYPNDTAFKSYAVDILSRAHVPIPF